MLSIINNFRYVDGLSFSRFKLLVMLYEKGPLDIHQIAEYGHMSHRIADSLRSHSIKNRLIKCVKSPTPGHTECGLYDLEPDIKVLFDGPTVS